MVSVWNETHEEELLLKIQSHFQEIPETRKAEFPKTKSSVFPAGQR